MVKVRDLQLSVFEKRVNIDNWLAEISDKLDTHKTHLLKSACGLAQIAGEAAPNFFGESCFHQGLVMADLLASLRHVDQATIACALIYPSVQYAELDPDTITDHLNDTITTLVKGVCQMDAASTFEYYSSNAHQHDHIQVDNVRRMLLAMVEDVRVVLIKLAERTYLLRAASVASEAQQQQLAKETFDIYAPLASRLGISQIKWELEDLAFRYLEPATYKKIAKRLDQRRLDREKYVNTLMDLLQKRVDDAGINNTNIHGRAKHIYSIYRKMQRKNVDFDQIYDATAVRVLVNTVEDCYKVLSCVHDLWQPIPEEFDDYIATPKPNGYRSIHTAIKDEYGRNVEVQIRTHEMHQESELGVAAHWIYKEGKPTRSGYEQKITWLRQVLEWQSELTKTHQPADPLQAQAFDDRIYVFTPAGHVLDLPSGATPLDFAYHVHSEVGHRCRGAKVNGSIVNLSYLLQTGEQVEIITGKEPAPSRDWLNPHLGYLHSSRAKAKVHHWFKQQDHERHVQEGEALLSREIKRLHLKNLDLDLIAHHLQCKTKEDLLAGLGAGDLRIPQILHVIQTLEQKTTPPLIDAIHLPDPNKSNTSKSKNQDISINGVGHLLTYIAKCCHPVPGDPIIGYISVGRGVTIHHQACPNIQEEHKHAKARFIAVHWGNETQQYYPVDIVVKAYDRTELMRDITQLIAAEKLRLLSLNTQAQPSEQIGTIHFTLEIHDLNQLSRLLGRIQQLPAVVEVARK